MNVVASKSGTIQFGIAWNWEHDADFIELIDRACWQQGISCYRVGPHNLIETLHDVQANRRHFISFLDRASDEDPRFYQLNLLLQATRTRFINAHHRYQWSIDKANIHGELASRGLNLPLTVILPSHDHEPEFNPSLLEPFLKPFVIKPSRGGGGVGVLLDARHADDVIRTRIKLRQQRLLLQQHIKPQVHNGRRAWFRVYHVCGEIIPCWWADDTHVYAMMTPGDRDVINHDELSRIMKIIAEVSQLDFFSAEIALDGEGRYVVIDYVNDPCDMRLQTKYRNGVPVRIVEQIVGCILAQVRKICGPCSPVSETGSEFWP